MPRLYRLGGLIVFLGVSSILLFVLSISSKMPDARFLFWGVGLFIAGAILRMTHPQPDGIKSNRFRLLQKRRDEEK